MKIFAVCGAGIGTSVILKSNLDRVIARLGLEADVQAVSLSEALKPENNVQIIFTTAEILEHLTGLNAEIVEVDNIFDLAELEFKVQASLG
jgi:PTS system ascorbate-specific IIB component